MADPRFYDNAGPFALGDVAERIGGTLAPGTRADIQLYDVASLEGGGNGLLCYAIARKNLSASAGRPPGPVIAPPDLAATLDSGDAVIVHKDPVGAFAAASVLFYPSVSTVCGSRGEDAVDPTARIGTGAVVEPGAVIGAGATIGAGTTIGANAVIGRGVQIGRDCFIGPNVSILYALVGDRVRIHAGASIGADGFAYTPGAAGLIKVPQLGRVILQDDVEIGANSCVDRGALDDTVLGEGTKLDNLVQIGHNCRLGRYCIVISQTGLSGSVTLGDFVVMAGQSAVADHKTIGAGARFAARSAVIHDLPGGQDYGGAPAQPAAEWRRELIAMRRLAKGKMRPNG